MAEEDTGKAKDLLDWMGVRALPDFAKARWIGAGVGVLLTALFLLALSAAGVVLFHTIAQGTNPDTQGPNLGAGALIAALLGAPFLIWGTWLKYQTVRYQKEGHITDRINKAVEQLGAEKKVDRIGRAVTIWTGEKELLEVSGTVAEQFIGKPRTKVAPKSWEGTSGAFEKTFDQNNLHLVQTWPADRTVIEYKDEKLSLAVLETIGVEGSWQVYSETVPNIEVRIGAILSLERIAQDSIMHDNGRDHVRVMEILCAYARGNSKNARISDDPLEKPSVRLDIQVLVDVLKRRTKEQIALEGRVNYRLEERLKNLRVSA